MDRGAGRTVAVIDLQDAALLGLGSQRSHVGSRKQRQRHGRKRTHAPHVPLPGCFGLIGPIDQEVIHDGAATQPARPECRRIDPAGLNAFRATADPMTPRWCSAQWSLTPAAGTCQTSSLSPPLRSRISRASSGVATSQAQALDDLARERDLLGVRRRQPAGRRPTANPPGRRGCCRPSRPPSPRSAAGCARRPAPTRRYLSPNSRSAVRFMCSTSSGCAPMPPCRPNTVWTKQRRLHQAPLEEVSQRVEMPMS